MKEGGKVVNCVSRVQAIHNQLKQAGVAMSEETLVGRIVSGLTSSFHVFMTNWANNSTLKQTLAELLPRLTAEKVLISKMKRDESCALFTSRQPDKRKNKLPNDTIVS